MAAQHYGPQDGDLGALEGQRVAVVGYGDLGRSAALNLRDSGVDVLVGSRPGPDGDRADEEGFRVLRVDEAITGADVVWLALPDEAVPEVLDRTSGVQPRPGSALVLSSGYALAYDLATVPDDLDVLLIAPRMIGRRIRTRYVAGDGFYSYVSVVQDATGTARGRLLGLAAAVGTLRAGAFEVAPDVEAALDLYVEQALGPVLAAAVLAAFEVGATQGLPPEALALELYLSGETGATWDAVAEHGFFPGVRQHGPAAEGSDGFVRPAGVNPAAMKRQFAEILDDIVSGRFARRFQEERERAPTSAAREVVDEMIAGDEPWSQAEPAARGTDRS